MGKLTERQIEAWVRRGEGVAGKSDGDGLTFTLSKAGAASWVLRYRHGGKQKEVTIGSYPDVSLSVARKLARAARAKVDQGVDLALKKRVEKAEAARAGSFRQLADDYLARTASALSASTREEARRYLDKDIVPRIGFHPVDQIVGADRILTTPAG